MQTPNATAKFSNTLSSGVKQLSNPPDCDEPDGHYIIVPGSPLADKYKILRLLGYGTYGRVVECADNNGNRLAVKIIRAVKKYRDAAQTELAILRKVAQSKDNHGIIRLLDNFDHKNHVCLVFPLLSSSIYDFVESNQFKSFPLLHLRHVAAQLFHSVAFLHDKLHVVDTDLKPENILLLSDAHRIVKLKSGEARQTRLRSTTSRTTKLLQSTQIQLIDLGSAILNESKHSVTVTTRHYRAPEVLLRQGWSYPCDVWSIGCILVELLAGEAMFQTHEDTEHLKIMQNIIGGFDSDYISSIYTDDCKKHFTECGSGYKINFPVSLTEQEALKYVQSVRPLQDIILSKSHKITTTVPQQLSPSKIAYRRREKLLDVDRLQPGSLNYEALQSLLDLLSQCFQYNPSVRCTAADALKHDFFKSDIKPEWE